MVKQAIYKTYIALSSFSIALCCLHIRFKCAINDNVWDVKVKFGNKHDVYEVLVLTIHCRTQNYKKLFVSVAKMLVHEISVKLLVG